jgi:hypothetical protein
LPYNQPFQVIGFHSCDREIGINVLNGKAELLPSVNSWDWLGNGIYFWEDNPMRALEYAEENSIGKQFNKKKIITPFVIGAVIELGYCLNLVETESLQIVKEAYEGLALVTHEAGDKMPVNKGNNKALDCAVFKYIHQSNKIQGKKQYDTIRCPFQEGVEVYPNSTISDRLHMQICVINSDNIKGYFLPKPIRKYNPYL